MSQQQWYEQSHEQEYLITHKDKHMKISDMIESKYVKQSDIDGEELVTVHSLKKVNVARDDEDPEYRWTVKFEELPKNMVLNVTNLKRMAKALGDDTDGWIGKQVVVYVDPDIEFGGSVVGGLRIRAATKAKIAPKQPSVGEINRMASDASDEVPF